MGPLLCPYQDCTVKISLKHEHLAVAVGIMIIIGGHHVLVSLTDWSLRFMISTGARTKLASATIQSCMDVLKYVGAP